jgi:hypothetical protein
LPLVSVPDVDADAPSSKSAPHTPTRARAGQGAAGVAWPGFGGIGRTTTGRGTSDLAGDHDAARGPLSPGGPPHAESGRAALPRVSRLVGPRTRNSSKRLLASRAATGRPAGGSAVTAEAATADMQGDKQHKQVYCDDPRDNHPAWLSRGSARSDPGVGCSRLGRQANAVQRANSPTKCSSPCCLTTARVPAAERCDTRDRAATW